MRDELYFEKIGKNFEDFMSEYDVARRIYLIFKDLLKHQIVQKDASVLEVGCGTGRITQEIKKISNNITVNDISERLVQEVGTRYACHCVAGDCANLQIDDETFDLVISSECIEHTADPFSALKEMKRVLKKGGMLVLTTPNRLWYPVLWLAEILKVRKYRGVENWVSPHNVRKWLLEEGFFDIALSGCHILPWNIPFIKKILPWFDKRGRALYPFMINFGFFARKL